MRLASCLAIVSVLVVLAGCGQKGPLYLPQPAPARKPPATATAKPTENKPAKTQPAAGQQPASTPPGSNGSKP